MTGQRAFSRWKSFYTTFDLIDAAIEAVDTSISRDEFRRMRVQIVEMLCAAEEDGLKAELCVILDEVMAESLVTLQCVPADVVPSILASSAGLATAVAGLWNHDSERVCGLARDLIRGWKASVEDDIVRMTAAIAQLDAAHLPTSESRASSHVSSDGNNAPSNPRITAASLVINRTAKPSGPRKTVPAMMTDKQAPVKMSESVSKIKEREPCRPTRMASRSTAASSHVTDGQSNNQPLHHQHEAKKHQAKIQQSPPHTTKKMAPAVVVGSGRVKASEVSPLPKKTVPSHEERMEATKRKLHDGYQEVVDAKRRRMIRVIEAPKMFEERRRKMHPILRERIRERCGNSTATVRRSLLSTFHRG